MNWQKIIPDGLEWKLIACPSAELAAGGMNKMF